MPDTPSEESIPYIEAGHILDAINPLRCIFCTHKKVTPGVNTTCNACDTRLANDAPLLFLHEKTLELYNYWIAISKETISSSFHITACSPDHSVVFYCNVRYTRGQAGAAGPRETHAGLYSEWRAKADKNWRGCTEAAGGSSPHRHAMRDVIGLMTQLMQKELLDALK
jgi:hypothetical protein